MLARRFVLYLLLPLLLLVVGAEVTVYFLTASHLRAEQERSLVAAAEALDAAISARLAGLVTDVDVMAAFPEVAQHFQMAGYGKRDAAHARLMDLEESYVSVAELKPRCKAIRLFDADGRAQIDITDARRMYRKLDASGERWFQDALDAGADDTLISAVHPDLTKGLPVITVAKAVRLDGRPLGVVAVDVLAGDLAVDVMPTVRDAASAHVYLLDPDGIVLASDQSDALGTDLRGRATTLHVLAGERGVAVDTDEDGTSLRVAYLPQATTHLGLVLTVPEDSLLGPVDRLRDTVLIITLAGLSLVALLGLGLVRRIVQPLHLLTAGAARVAQGDLDQFVDVRTGDELQDLAQSFNEMNLSLREAVDAKDRRAKELEAAYQDLQETQRQLNQAEKMGLLGQLAGGIAHDFNNLLSGILGCADLLKRDSGTPGSKQRYVEIILTAARRAADLVQQLLAFARPGETQQTSVDMNELVAEVVRILQRTVDPRIQVETQLNAQQCVVRGDPSELQSALLNLGVNARDAIAEHGTITFTTEQVEVDEDTCRRQAHPIKPGPYLEIGVADTGSGMDPQVLEHIFEPFFTTKDVGKGTGLGLAAVYGTIRGHDGSINVYSEPGQGTQFRLFIPLAVDEKGIAGPMESAELVRGTGTILLVDDEPIIRNLGNDMLRSMGYEVILAIDGKEALETWDARGAGIDLVILDLVMPGKNGKQVLREILDRDPAARVLVTSGFQFAKSAPDIRKEGAVGFLPKPFIPTSLSRAVAAALTASPASSRDGRPGRSLHVLCADDSAVNREVLDGLLVELGHDVVVVDDGEQALHAAREQRFDLVLLDLEMPNMGGLEAAQRLREEHGASLPILGMSGQGSAANQERCREAGMRALLRKPLSVDILQAAIDAQLGRGPVRVARDETLPQRLGRVFIEEAPRLIGQLREAVAAGDAVAVHRAAHTLHGSLRHFDAARASGLSDRLQGLAGGRDLGEAAQLAEELATECDRLLESLESAMADTVGSGAAATRDTRVAPDTKEET